MIDGNQIDWEYCQTEKFLIQEQSERNQVKEEYDLKRIELEESEELLKENMVKEREKYQKMIQDK